MRLRTKRGSTLLPAQTEAEETNAVSELVWTKTAGGEKDCPFLCLVVVSVWIQIRGLHFTSTKFLAPLTTTLLRCRYIHLHKKA